jgi:hypothetical protein
VIVLLSLHAVLPRLLVPSLLAVPPRLLALLNLHLHALLPRFNRCSDDRRNLLDRRPCQRGYVAKHVKRHTLQSGTRQGIADSLNLALRCGAVLRLEKLLHTSARGLASADAFLGAKLTAGQRTNNFGALNDGRSDRASA